MKRIIVYIITLTLIEIVLLLWRQWLINGGEKFLDYMNVILPVCHMIVFILISLICLLFKSVKTIKHFLAVLLCGGILFFDISFFFPIIFIFIFSNIRYYHLSLGDVMSEYVYNYPVIIPVILLCLIKLIAVFLIWKQIRLLPVNVKCVCANGYDNFIHRFIKDKKMLYECSWFNKKCIILIVIAILISVFIMKRNNLVSHGEKDSTDTIVIEEHIGDDCNNAAFSNRLLN